MLFRDRFHGGEELLKKLLKYKGENVVVLGIPRGGVHTGYPIAKGLGAHLDVIVPRKLPVPWNPEVGFGAVTSTGDVVLNENIVREVDLSPDEISAIVENVKEEIGRRMKVYRGGKPLPVLRDKIVIIADDGLATGYTMIAAIASVRKQSPKKVVATAPVSPKDTCEKVAKYADEVVTLWSKPTMDFAVGEFYEDFHDMKDEEVTSILKEF